MSPAIGELSLPSLSVDLLPLLTAPYWLDLSIREKATGKFSLEGLRYIDPAKLAKAEFYYTGDIVKVRYVGCKMEMSR